MSDFYPHKQTHPGGSRPLTLADGAPNEERPPGEFRDAGGLWLANTILHALGWTLILEHTGEAPDRLYAARTRYRGFDATVTKQGYERVARWLRDQGPALYAEAAHEGEAPSSKLEMAAFDAAREARRYAKAQESATDEVARIEDFAGLGRCAACGGTGREPAPPASACPDWGPCRACQGRGMP